jgi:hypothetical protein
MKRTTNILIGLTIASLIAFGQGKIKTINDAMGKFEKFKATEKFIEDSTILYPGNNDVKMRKILTTKINLAADDFKALATSGKATNREYQEKIKAGLERFADICLDTEDRERICHYFEELMDMVGLDSSNGYLNNFMYGLGPKNNN